MTKSSIDKLRAQRDQLNARIQKQEALLKTAQRKQDTRKKILVGSYYLDMAVKENKMHDIKELMDNFLKRNSDRTLFDLDPLPES